MDFCGDGRKITSKCDDGNRNRGDGCSENCEIERGYFCQELAPNGRDFCFYHDYNVYSEKVQINEGHIQIDLILSPFTVFTEK